MPDFHVFYFFTFFRGHAKPVPRNGNCACTGRNGGARGELRYIDDYYYIHIRHIMNL